MSDNTIRPLVRVALGLLSLVAAVVASSLAASAQEKLKPEEIVAKHLEAVGASAARAAVKNRVALGTVVATFRSPSPGSTAGRMVMASEGDKHLLGMVFDNTPDYPQEKFGFDGKDVSLSYVRPGRRSTLGEVFQTHKSLIKQGIIGGTLSSAWPLFAASDKRGKIESAGIKKVGERQAYALKYLPRGGSDMEIVLYFDTETFQHLRTEYTRTIAAQMARGGVGAPGREGIGAASAGQRESRYRMLEDFSDFRKEGALTLPHKYKLTLEISMQNGSYKADWEASLLQFSFNEQIDPNSFDVDGD